MAVVYFNALPQHSTAENKENWSNSEFAHCFSRRFGEFACLHSQLPLFVHKFYPIFSTPVAVIGQFASNFLTWPTLSSTT